MRILLLFPLLLLSGCTTDWEFPITYPKHLDFSMTGVTVSWPVVLAVFAVVVLVLWVRAKINKDK